MKPTCRWLVPENTSTAVPRYRRYIGDITHEHVRYLTVTFNITFPKCFVAKLRLLEFALHQDVVINYFNRRLIQNTADITSKCVARLQNAAIPITKCATLSQNASLLQNDAEHKLLLFIGFRTFLRTLFLWQWSANKNFPLLTKKIFICLLTMTVKRETCLQKVWVFFFYVTTGTRKY